MSTEASHIRALIRTLPLSRGNYGGMLQAYALQQALAALGVEADTDVSYAMPRDTMIRAAILRAKGRVVPRPMRPVEVDDARRRPMVTRFLDRHVSTVSIYDPFGRLRPQRLEGYDAFITGSDQVWRKRYGMLASYFFDFLSADDARIRVSYAASFGKHPSHEYTAEDVAVVGGLLERFTAVGVREHEAVDQVSELWGIEATHNVDPVMLLDASRYREIAGGPAFESPELARQRGDAPAHAFTYVLDPREELSRVTAAAAAEASVPEVRLPLKQPTSVAEYNSSPSRFALPHLEDWLRGFIGADYVVTDSFHGTVLSILLHKPFVSLVNQDRGADRFHTLAALPGLADRFLDPTQLIEGEGAATIGRLVDTEIDWSAVDAAVSKLRADSVEFLARGLGLD